jgi:hypothetical protein
VGVVGLTQAGQGRLHHRKWPLDIDLQQPAKVLGRQLVCGAQVQRTGIVDHDVDAAKCVGDLGHGRGGCVGVAHVAGDGHRLTACRMYRVGRLAQRPRDLGVGGFGLGEQSHASAVGGRAHRDFASDAAAGARDDYDAVPQATNHGLNHRAASLPVFGSHAAECYNYIAH